MLSNKGEVRYENYGHKVLGLKAFSIWAIVFTVLSLVGTVPSVIAGTATRGDILLCTLMVAACIACLGFVRDCDAWGFWSAAAFLLVYTYTNVVSSLLSLSTVSATLTGPMASLSGIVTGFTVASACVMAVFAVFYAIQLIRHHKLFFGAVVAAA